MTAIAPARPRATGPVAAPQAVPARHAPARRPGHRPGRHLRPVERPRHRRSPVVPALVGVGMVIAALLTLAVMHALLIGGQVRLDGMRRDVAAESEAIRRLELRVAELESPDRVLDVARERLGMVQPDEVGYLLPVGVAGGPDEPVRVAPAELPSEPEPEAGEGSDGETRSPEQAEVDDAVAGEEPADTETDSSTTSDTDGSDADAEAEQSSDPEVATAPPVAGGRDE